MTDFRNLRPDHDLRSQLGLKPFDREAFAKDVCTTLSADQLCKMSILGEALRIEAKPLNPALATPDPLHRTIAAMGCLSRTKSLRTALAVNKLFSGTRTSNMVVNVTNNGEQLMDKDASEIVANIRKMIDSPEVQHLRAIGQLTLDQASVDEPVQRATNFRALSKIHDHVESLESDILELLVMAGANPHADRRRLDAARTQFELAFMMMKKAVDPEQERE